jgi:MFS family permease
MLTMLGMTTPLFMVTITAIVMGVGFGAINNTFMLAVQNAIPRERLGVGTGAVAYLRTIGQTVGTAILGTVVISASTKQFSAVLPETARPVLAVGLHTGFLIVLGVCGVMLLLALLLKDVPLHENTSSRDTEKGRVR